MANSSRCKPSSRSSPARWWCPPAASTWEATWEATRSKAWTSIRPSPVSDHVIKNLSGQTLPDRLTACVFCGACTDTETKQDQLDLLPPLTFSTFSDYWHHWFVAKEIKSRQAHTTNGTKWIHAADVWVAYRRPVKKFLHHSSALVILLRILIFVFGCLLATKNTVSGLVLVGTSCINVIAPCTALVGCGFRLTICGVECLHVEGVMRDLEKWFISRSEDPKYEGVDFRDEKNGGTAINHDITEQMPADTQGQSVLEGYFWLSVLVFCSDVVISSLFLYFPYSESRAISSMYSTDPSEYESTYGSEDVDQLTSDVNSWIKTAAVLLVITAIFGFINFFMTTILTTW